MSIADADAKAAMPDGVPDVGAMLKSTMSQPIRKGTAKWTDTVRKLAVRFLTPIWSFAGVPVHCVARSAGRSRIVAWPPTGG